MVKIMRQPKFHILSPSLSARPQIKALFSLHYAFMQYPNTHIMAAKKRLVLSVNLIELHHPQRHLFKTRSRFNMHDLT